MNDADTIVHTMLQLYPIKQLRVEYLRFDTQLMQNPDVRGVEYQRSTLQGWQLRHYISSQCPRITPANVARRVATSLPATD